MKIYLTILLLLLILPVLVFAADVDISGILNVSVAGITVVVNGAANSIVTTTDSGDNFSVTLGDAMLTITSADKKITSASVPSSASYTVESSCDTSSSYISIRGVADTSITVTPLTTACSSGGGGGGVISGGGGSSSGFAPSVPLQTAAVAAAIIPATTPVAVSAPTPAGSGVPLGGTVSVGISPVFSSTLKLGVTNSDTKRLQKLLNSDPDTQIASTGVGSPGNETEYFGSLTVKALQKFQKKYNVVSSGSPETTGYGALGPKTRAKLVEVFSQATPTAPAVAHASPTGGQPSPIAVSVSPVFTIGFGIGKTSSDVKRLQQLLNSNPDTQISSSGTGSSGNETNYFGSLTEKAVQKFQKKYNIAKEGDSGYGYIGPKTRAKIQEVFGGTVESSVAPAPVAPVAPVSTPAPVVPTPAPQTVTPSTQTEEVPAFLRLTPAPTPQ